MTLRYQQIDVFGSGPFTGNPLAVVHDADDLDTEDMQQITRWLNLSETTFLLRPTRPGADYRVRIFTLARELPFAGHPTLGSCHAWLSGQNASPNRDVTQECGAGLISLRSHDGVRSFEAPPLLRFEPVDPTDLAELAAVLGISLDDIDDASWVDNGPGWVGILLRDAASVLELEPDFRRSSRTGSLDIGVIGPHRPDNDAAYEVRAFFSDQRGAMVEDPVTGSLNASLAQWLTGSGRATAPYVTAQGTKVGRRGRVTINVTDDGAVWVGGAAITVIDGTIRVRAT